MILPIEDDEHVTIVASTGEGKTFFDINAIIPAQTQNRNLVIDTEDRDFDEKIFPKVSPQRALGALKSNKPFRMRVVWGVDSKAQQSFDAFCWAALKHGHDARIHIDEVCDFSDASRIGDGLLALVRKGRKRNLPVAVGSQRPQHLHKIFPSQSKHLFILYLDEEDRARWGKNSGPVWLDEWLPQLSSDCHKCIYRNKKAGITLLSPVPKFNFPAIKKKTKIGPMML